VVDGRTIVQRKMSEVSIESCLFGAARGDSYDDEHKRDDEYAERDEWETEEVRAFVKGFPHD